MRIVAAGRRAARGAWPAPRREAESAFGDGTRLRRALRRAVPPRRGADLRRRLRAGSSTSTSASARSSGGTRRSSRRRPARRWTTSTRAALHAGRGPGRRGDRLHQRRHRRVPPGPPGRRAGRVLLPRGQHPPPGRAPGDRGRPGRRPGRAPARGGGRRLGARTRTRSDRCRATRSRPGSTPRTRRADFRPSTGTVHRFAVPGRVRLDSSLDGGGEVTQFYDPMIAKVIAHAPTRDIAAHRLASSLASATIDGIVTNRELLVRTLRHPEFLGDRGDSQFLERNDPAAMGRPLVEGDGTGRLRGGRGAGDPGRASADRSPHGQCRHRVPERGHRRPSA